MTFFSLLLLLCSSTTWSMFHSLLSHSLLELLHIFSITRCIKRMVPSGKTEANTGGTSSDRSRVIQGAKNSTLCLSTWTNISHLCDLLRSSVKCCCCCCCFFIQMGLWKLKREDRVIIFFNLLQVTSVSSSLLYRITLINNFI